jgi:hypothetical protein
MNDWRAIKKEAEQAKGLLVADRSAGEQQFEALISRHPGDGMLYLQRAQALEAVGDRVAAASDYSKALVMLPMAAWQKTAREGLARCSPNVPPKTQTASASGDWDDALLEQLPDALQRRLWRDALANDDPRAQVTLIRGALEKTLGHLLAVRDGVSPTGVKSVDLFDQTRTLENLKVIGPETVAHLHTVRVLGNVAAHPKGGGDIGEDELAACRVAARAALKAVVKAGS